MKLQSRIPGTPGITLPFSLSLSLSLLPFFSLFLFLRRRRSLRFEKLAGKVIGWKGRKRSKARIPVAARFVGIIVLIKLDYLPLPFAHRRESKGNQKVSLCWPKYSRSLVSSVPSMGRVRCLVVLLPSARGGQRRPSMIFGPEAESPIKMIVKLLMAL